MNLYKIRVPYQFSQEILLCSVNQCVFLRLNNEKKQKFLYLTLKSKVLLCSVCQLFISANSDFRRLAMHDEWWQNGMGWSFLSFPILFFSAIDNVIFTSFLPAIYSSAFIIIIFIHFFFFNLLLVLILIMIIVIVIILQKDVSLSSCWHMFSFMRCDSMAHNTIQRSVHSSSTKEMWH